MADTGPPATWPDGRQALRGRPRGPGGRTGCERRDGIGYLCDMAMRDDPIVAQVRAIRGKLAAECGYDVEEIVRRVWKRQAESGLEYVNPPPRRPGRMRRDHRRTRVHGGMTMELETTTKVPVERLRLDRGNPRLDGEGRMRPTSGSSPDSTVRPSSTSCSSRSRRTAISTSSRLSSCRSPTARTRPSWRVTGGWPPSACSESRIWLAGSHPGKSSQSPCRR